MEWWLSSAEGWDDEELLVNAYRVSVWGDETVLAIDGGDGYTTV